MINATTLVIAILFLASGLSSNAPIQSHKPTIIPPDALTGVALESVKNATEHGETPVLPAAKPLSPQLRAFLCQPVRVTRKQAHATECTRTDI